MRLDAEARRRRQVTGSFDSTPIYPPNYNCLDEMTYWKGEIKDGEI